MRNEVIGVLLVIILMGSVGVGYYVGNSSRQTITTTITSSFTAVSTTTLTVAMTENSSSELPAQCSHAAAPTPTGILFGTVTAGANTPAVICVQFYYLNSTTPTTQPISIVIQAAQTNRSFSGDSNFTIAASENQLVFGGPQNENEGAVVAFTVTAKPGASGTYELSFSGKYMLTPTEPAECAYYGTLVAGDGHPLYVFPEGCITYNISGTNTNSLPTIQGIPYPILSNTLFFRVVGVINSTG